MGRNRERGKRKGTREEGEGDGRNGERVMFNPKTDMEQEEN